MAVFGRKSGEWRAEQSRMLPLIEDHQKADQIYLTSRRSPESVCSSAMWLRGCRQ